MLACRMTRGRDAPFAFHDPSDTPPLTAKVARAEKRIGKEPVLTEREAPLTAECLGCGVESCRARSGMCSIPRSAGIVARRPGEREQADPEQVAWLFDEGRDPE
jgi:hypothetical protein